MSAARRHHRHSISASTTTHHHHHHHNYASRICLRPALAVQHGLNLIVAFPRNVDARPKP